MRIFKYELLVEPGVQTYVLPVGSVLDVQVQQDKIVFWIPDAKHKVY